jgi:carboxylate-amine ligase
MDGFEDFQRYTTRLTAIADVPDYTFHWWKLRPHPRLGTVEIRALDVQASLAHTAGLVAAIHALARHEADAADAPGPPPEILEEASFRAARAGVDAALPDSEGKLRPATELLAETIELARPRADELGCGAELDYLATFAETGGGAGLQRAAHREGGMDAVLRALLELA